MDKRSSVILNYEAIKEFAVKDYLDKPYSSVDEKIHLAKCYADATIRYLVGQGYVIKKEEK